MGENLKPPPTIGMIGWKGPTPTSPFDFLDHCLKRISYKPGWKIQLMVNTFEYDAFDVVVMYEAYESKNAAFEPICMESGQVQTARARLSASLGRSVRQDNRFHYVRRFYKSQVERMRPDEIIRYVIGETIRQAELYEFERWFRYEEVKVFDSVREDEQRIEYQPLNPLPP
jgi:hypothetical protein